MFYIDFGIRDIDYKAFFSDVCSELAAFPPDMRSEFGDRMASHILKIPSIIKQLHSAQ